MEAEIPVDVVESRICVNCGDPASASCEECDSFYCGQCSVLAHKHPKRQDHTVSPLEAEVVSCEGKMKSISVYAT